MEFARRQFLTLGVGTVIAAAGATAFGSAKVQTARSLIQPVRQTPGGPITPAPALTPIDTPALPLGEFRRAAIHNLHTGEALDVVYWEKGKYVPDALAEAMRVMRDWRNGQEHVMDPRLFDVLHGIQSKLGNNKPFQLISGYRSPETNAHLHAESGQVASHSQHMLGKASDIRVEGVELATLHRAAQSLKAGGVGFYPVSNFVHVDVGPVRQWSGT
jgi:uncharacterized protein YcbK (DUF882 family)